MVPASYSEFELATAMHRWLGPVADALGWSANTSYHEAVIDTLLAYGETSLANATDTAKLRALARLAVWLTAEAALSIRVDVAGEAGSLKLSQAYDHAKDMVAELRGVASAYLGTNRIEVTSVTSKTPYDVPDRISAW